MCAVLCCASVVFHTFCSSVLLSSILLFDWWKWFLVDINTMEQFTVVKISTLSFIIHMCVSCFDSRFSLYLFGRRVLTHTHTNTPMCVVRACMSEWVSARACVRIKALHTSKNQSHKLSPLRKWNIYIYYTRTHIHTTTDQTLKEHMVKDIEMWRKKRKMRQAIDLEK